MEYPLGMAKKPKLDPDAMIPTAQAARELGLQSDSRVRQLIAEGKLVATKLGRDWLIKRSDLDAVRERPKAGRPSRG